jgi:hypothetical protein
MRPFFGAAERGAEFTPELGQQEKSGREQIDKRKAS